MIIHWVFVQSPRPMRRPRALFGGRSIAELFQISADYIDEFIRCFGSWRVFSFFGVEDMKLDMAFNQFGHQSVQGAPTRRDLLQQVGTLVLVSERSFNRFHLPANPADSPEKLLSVSCCVRHRAPSHLLTMVGYSIVRSSRFWSSRLPDYSFVRM